MLDNGRPFLLEDFQEEIAADVFAGYPEIWLILPEESGKTTYLAELALYFGDYIPSAMIPIAASSREQAEIMYRQAEGLITRSPDLHSRFRAYDGYRRIKCLRTGGRIQVYAADDRTGDGIIPGGLALIDELHRHRDLKLYRTWRGKLDKRGAQLVAISTAGEPGGEFEETRDRIKRTATDVTRKRGGCHVRYAADGIVLHDFSVPSAKQAEDMDVVARANPRAEVTAERLRRKRASPTMTAAHWLRFVCNIATRESSTPITAEDLDPLALPDLETTDIEGYGWLDLGWKIDTTAMGVLLWESSERRIAAGFKVLEPPVDEADIVAGLLHLQLRFPRLRGFVVDPNAGGQQMAQLLEKGEHPLQTDDEKRARYGLPPLSEGSPGPLEFIAHSQDNAPMSQAATRFDEALRGSIDDAGEVVRPATFRWVREGDWEKFRRHCLNAARKNLGGEKWRYDRPSDAKGANRAKYPIDGLTGVLIGHNFAVEEALAVPDECIVEVFG